MPPRARTALFILLAWLSAAASFAAPRNPDGPAIREGIVLRDALVKEADRPGKPAWKPMLVYLAGLHGRAMHPPLPPLKYAFEEVAPGYDPGGALPVAPGTTPGLAFGTIDLAYHRLDTVRALPEHVRNQTRNELAFQQPDGMIAALVTWDKDGHPRFKDYKSFVPGWVVAIDEYIEITSDTAFLQECLDALVKQIGWFEAKRRAAGGGFYYLDIVQNTWESGMDEGIRYDDRPAVPSAAVDASSHLFMLYEHAAAWSRQLGRPADAWAEKARELRRFIQQELWEPSTGFFYDAWTVRDPAKRHLAVEGMWPMAVGAATPEQARRVIDEHLLNKSEFFTEHPIPSVALSDPKFELRMWRGPTWNALTYCAARGCMRYGRNDAAHQLLEKALDATAIQFERTHTIWEFYHPMLGEQTTLKRKDKGRAMPCPDYHGHSPLFAMADLWRKTAP